VRRTTNAYMKQAAYAATLGAVGKWCMHPNQIPLANDVFAPSPREIKQAQKMVDLYNESVPKGAGAGGKGEQLVDAATLRIYEPVVERARATGRLSERRWSSGLAAGLLARTARAPSCCGHSPSSPTATHRHRAPPARA